jgi:hypothetical protein
VEEIMKIAVCLSGQPRTWKECLPNWIENLGLNNETDFYFHLWDYNTLPSLVSSKTNIKDELLSELEKQEIIDVLKPKNFKFESRKHISYWNCTIPEHLQFGPWCREQFYSLYYVSLLKKEYEIQNDFRYDLVLRLRSDLWLDDKIILDSPAANTAYTSHCSYDAEYNVYRIGDIFYYADSSTFDQVAQFYKFLSYIPTNWVTDKTCPPPEIAMSYFFTNIGVLNKPTHAQMKIKRDERVLQLKGGLESYEI